MLKTSFSVKNAWVITKNVKDREYNKILTYNPETTVSNEKAYIFSRQESSYGMIFYLVGAQTTPYEKVMAALGAVNILKQMYDALPDGVHLYFTRKTSDSINNFADVLENRESVFENIPRLYKVKTDFIVQIQLNPELVDNENAFVLHGRSAVTVYYSHSLDNNIRNLTKLFSNYIVKFEKKKYDVYTPISELDSRKLFEAAHEKFIRKIKEIVKFLPENNLKNTGTINEEFNAKISLTSDDDNHFEKIRKAAINRIKSHMSQSATDSIDYDKISSTGTTSTSTSSAMEDEAVKLEGEVQSSLVMSKTPYLLTNSADLRFIYENPIIILGPPECQLEGKTEQVESFEPSCVYILRDFTNNELFVYFGKGGDEMDYLTAVSVVEGYYLHNNPSTKITYICDDGNLIPPPFIIHFKNELRKIFIYSI